MGMLDKFLNRLKLNDDEEDEYYDDDYLDDEEEEEPAPPPRRSSSKVRDIEDYGNERAAAPYSRRQPYAAPSSKVTPIKQSASRRSSIGNGMEVCVIRPTSMEDAREITDTLLANRTVVLNLEGLETEIAQRILDFASGSCLALSGRLQMISKYIFIITPPSVDISGDFTDVFNPGMSLHT